SWATAFRVGAAAVRVVSGPLALCYGAVGLGGVVLSWPCEVAPAVWIHQTPMADMGIVLKDGEKVAEANRRIAAASASRSQRCPKSCTTTERSTDGGKTWGLRTDVPL